MGKTARQLVLDVLCCVEEQHAYSSIAFNRAVREASLSPQDTAFAAALLYGVLERRISLDHRLSPYLKNGVSALDCAVRNILRAAVYELCYLDGVPDWAAVSEAVRLTRYAKKASAAGLVNAVLRRFIREGKPEPAQPEDFIPRASVAYGCPEWIVAQWRAQYGEDTALALCKSSLSRPPL